MKYSLLLKYVYTFYSFGEILDDGIFDEAIEITNQDQRFKLHDQEDGSFILSARSQDSLGNHVIVTFPNKDVIIVREGESVELAYDEYYSVMGDDNHNVYVGSLSLVKSEA